MWVYKVEPSSNIVSEVAGEIINYVTGVKNFTKGVWNEGKKKLCYYIKNGKSIIRPRDSSFNVCLTIHEITKPELARRIYGLLEQHEISWMFPDDEFHYEFVHNVCDIQELSLIIETDHESGYYDDLMKYDVKYLDYEYPDQYYLHNLGIYINPNVDYDCAYSIYDSNRPFSTYKFPKSVFINKYIKGPLIDRKINFGDTSVHEKINSVTANRPTECFFTGTPLTKIIAYFNIGLICIGVHPCIVKQIFRIYKKSEYFDARCTFIYLCKNPDGVATTQYDNLNKRSNVPVFDIK